MYTLTNIHSGLNLDWIPELAGDAASLQGLYLGSKVTFPFIPAPRYPGQGAWDALFRHLHVAISPICTAGSNTEQFPETLYIRYNIGEYRMEFVYIGTQIGQYDSDTVYIINSF